MIPISFLQIMTIPLIPGRPIPKFKADLMSEISLTLLPIADAAESARVADGDRTHTASAFPKLNEGPTEADDVQIPMGVSSGLISK